jgi:predicted PurR-regulated permease PerM
MQSDTPMNAPLPNAPLLPNNGPERGLRAEGSRADTGVPPREHNTIIRVSLFTIAVLLSTAAVTYLGRILEPLVFAVFLFFTIEPAAEWLRRFRMPRWLTYTLLLFVAMTVFVVVAQVTNRNLAQFHGQEGEYLKRLHDLADRISPGLGQSLQESLASDSGEMSRMAAWRVYGVTEFALMMFFYLLFIILNSDVIPGRVRRAFPDRADELLAIGERIRLGLSRYIGVKTITSLGLAVTAAIVMAVCHVDYWPLWAFLFFFLNYITYIGSIAACVPPIALAFLQKDLGPALLVTGLIIAARVFWIDYIEIRLSGRELNIDSVLLLLALAYWGWFWGVGGLVLAVPMLTCLKVILESIDDTRPWAILMSER